MNNNRNKTFKDLQKGDKIYAVVTDLPKLKVATLVIKHIEERYSGAYDFTVSWTENKHMAKNNIKTFKLHDV